MTEPRREISACFTGHRLLTKEQLHSLLPTISETVVSLWGRGITHYYAGGALGFDLAASVAVLNLKQRLPSLMLTLALPCRNHQKGWGRLDRELFDGVMARADATVYVNDAYFRGCMQRRNCYMVDRSSICVTYLTERRGGTYQTVRYAERKGLPILNLAGSFTGEQLCFDDML